MHDYHVHLYGCITAEQLWQHFKNVPDALNGPRFAWFESEYQRLTGRTAQVRELIEHNNFAGFKREFEVTDHVKFPEFQARFNLIIAAHPDRNLDGKVLREVSGHFKSEGLTGADFRIFTPHQMPGPDLIEYLRMITTESREIGAELNFEARLFLHLSRVTEIGRQQWAIVRQFFDQYPELCPVVRGTDFCEDEQTLEPHTISWLPEEIIQNGKPHDNFELTCHAGEVFDRIGPFASLIRLLYLIELGFKRFGHATILGVPALRWKGETVTTTREQWNAMNSTASRIKRFRSLLAPGLHILSGRLHLTGDHADIVVNDDLIGVINEWQREILATMKRENVTIETCPTSNRVLGTFGDQKFHPLRQLLASGADLVVGSDDPGIFGCSLTEEHRYVQQTRAQI